jgi:UDP-N-acetylmuramate dehydrogenase
MGADVKNNVSLRPYTSFHVGGKAELLAETDNEANIIELLDTYKEKQVWLLGYGSNTLISDKGLPGLTICIRGGDIKVNETMIIVDAGVWWDNVVKASIEHGLWGAELMSEIPGSVGAALFINITAYGQSIGPLVEWVEIWEPKSRKVVRISKDELTWSYKKSIFQLPEYEGSIILRAALKLSKALKEQLGYQKALDVADELNLDATSLTDRRAIIIESRERAGSIWSPTIKNANTVGSFFRNPTVDENQLDAIIAFDETGKTNNQVKKMNSVHGGQHNRVSAAHVMLAAGFRRGQSWKNVKLNDKNLLKIEALDGANAADIYKVMRHIQDVCMEKLGIKLEPEAQLFGEF